MLEGLAPADYRQPCRVKVVCGQLSETDAKILMDAINDTHTWNTSQLSKALAERKLKLSRYHIDKHRDKDCPC